MLSHHATSVEDVMPQNLMTSFENFKMMCNVENGPLCHTQTAKVQMSMLIWTFAVCVLHKGLFSVCQHILQYPSILQVGNKGPNQPLRMCRLIRVCACLGGTLGCGIQLETRRSRVQPPPRSATFFHGD